MRSFHMLHSQLFQSFGSLLPFREFFFGRGDPWLWPSSVGAALAAFIGGSEFHSPGAGIFIHRSSTVCESASIVGPAFIGEGTAVGHCA
ncbi:MAG: hypothetical protein LBI39_02850, partial [Puniceicoccales bacterium]|nr:hypothetical protein [Puniceicoccales bacterium]